MNLFHCHQKKKKLIMLQHQKRLWIIIHISLVCKAIRRASHFYFYSICGIPPLTVLPNMKNGYNLIFKWKKMKRKAAYKNQIYPIKSIILWCILFYSSSPYLSHHWRIKWGHWTILIWGHLLSWSEVNQEVGDACD